MNTNFILKHIWPSSLVIERFIKVKVKKAPFDGNDEFIEKQSTLSLEYLEKKFIYKSRYALFFFYQGKVRGA